MEPKTLKAWIEEMPEDLKALSYAHCTRRGIKETTLVEPGYASPDILYLGQALGSDFRAIPGIQDYLNKVHDAEVTRRKGLTLEQRIIFSDFPPSSKKVGKRVYIQHADMSNTVVDFYKEPFGNCQNFAIGNFQNLLSCFENTPEKVVEFCVHMARNRAGKKLMVLDIHEKHLFAVKTIFKDYEFKFISPYKSSNGSNMVMLMIQLYEY